MLDGFQAFVSLKNAEQAFYNYHLPCFMQYHSNVLHLKQHTSLKLDKRETMITLLFFHLADTFIHSDLQMRNRNELNAN